jgi:hypothetical protein
MTFKPSVWRPIAFVLAAINVVSVGPAAAAAEPWHASIHAALALACGWWAVRLGGQRSTGTLAGQPLVAAEIEDRLAALENETSNLRRELGEAQERLDFAERILAQSSEQRRVGPER